MKFQNVKYDRLFYPSIEIFLPCMQIERIPNDYSILKSKLENLKMILTDFEHKYNDALVPLAMELMRLDKNFKKNCNRWKPKIDVPLGLDAWNLILNTYGENERRQEQSRFKEECRKKRLVAEKDRREFEEYVKSIEGETALDCDIDTSHLNI